MKKQYEPKTPKRGAPKKARVVFQARLLAREQHAHERKIAAMADARAAQQQALERENNIRTTNASIKVALIAGAFVLSVQVVHGIFGLFTPVSKPEMDPASLVAPHSNRYVLDPSFSFGSVVLLAR